MKTKAIKCSGKDCDEVFHWHDNRIPGGINDTYEVSIKCKQCGAITKAILHNIDYLFQKDNFELIDKRELSRDEDWSSILSEIGESAEVVGYENINNPIHSWKVYETFSLWKNNKYNYEKIATDEFQSSFRYVNEFWDSYYNAYLAGQNFAPKVKQVFVYHNYKIGKKKCKALWVADFKEMHILDAKNFYLIHHNDADIIDGIYSRDSSLKYLERLLVRWKALCNEVIVATPFIGYDFPFSKDSDKKELIALWQLLNGLLDMDKTLFFTRSATYASLKKSQNRIDIPTDVLREWDLMTNLQKVVDNPKTRAKMKEKFHLKIYAGIFDNRVELFSGSYNVQTNDTMENMCLRNLSREHFKVHYMNEMIDNFAYKDSNNDDELLIILHDNGEYDYSLVKAQDIDKIISR